MISVVNALIAAVKNSNAVKACKIYYCKTHLLNCCLAHDKNMDSIANDICA